jgi:hypothetical protein
MSDLGKKKEKKRGGKIRRTLSNKKNGNLNIEEQ